MLVMPPKKKPKRIRKGAPLNIYLPQKLRDALDDSAEGNRRPVTSETIIALEEYLTRQGKWPPPRE